MGLSTLPKSLLPTVETVLIAAAKAPGNRSRFSQAGLLNDEGELTADWQAAFERLQPLDKAEVRSRPGNFLAQAHDVVFRGKTSGTQSEAFTYFANQQWNDQRVALRQRSLSWWGIDPATPMLNLASRLSPVRKQDTSLVGPIDADFLKTLRQALQTSNGSIILRGYPSRLSEVAVAIRASQSLFNFSPVVAVISTGECLFGVQKKLLSDTFHAPVINEYGCPETGISGLSCPEAGRIHLDGDRALYEIINGELLTTDLYNTTMPMVRYRNGDRLMIHPTPCPCGRAGPTARLLGRDTATITIEGQPYRPGEIDLPVFPGILNYQLQIRPNQRRLWVQLEDTRPEVVESHLLPLKAWLQDTLGTVSTEILIEPLNAIHARLETADSLTCLEDSATWVKQVQHSAWSSAGSSWLDKPPPLGAAQEIAILLRQLVAPRYVTGQGTPAQTLRLAQALSDRNTPALDSQVEAMKIRVLLWAAGCLDREDSAAKTFYLSVLTQFQQWAECAGPADLKQASAIGFDLLGPLLTIETATTQSLWPSVQTEIQRYWPDGLKADTFTMHHYLAVLDRAGRKAQSTSHPWSPRLRPLSAMLLGDFYRFASKLTPDLVTLWREIVQGEVLDFPQTSNENSFYEVWKQERRALLSGDRAKVTQSQAQLFNFARTPAQQSLCWLEKSYSTLLFEENIDPIEWTEILQQQIGVLPSPSTREFSQSAVNPLPWIPMLKALAPRLIETHRPQLAYACLFAAAPPNQQMSNFDRQTRDVNGKQSAVSFVSDEA